MSSGNLKDFKVLAITHKAIPLDLVGKFHIEPEGRASRLNQLREKTGLEELMYLSTCNRVEFIGKGGSLKPSDIIEALDLPLNREEIDTCIANAEYFEAEDAVKHLFKVTASLDSMVIGEREIITQVRKAFEECRDLGLTGDMIRLVMKKTIETAKTIFTETEVFKKPVSVVSLAFHRLRDLNVPESSRIIMLGAGKTNRAMAKFLAKHRYGNMTIYNRTIERAQKLAEETGTSFGSLDELKNHNGGFDVLITCTSSSAPVINRELLKTLVGEEESGKLIIDLAIPSDVDRDALKEFDRISYISIEELKAIAQRNLADRSREIQKCEEIIDHNLIDFHDLYKQREIELAMRDIPQKVKEIREVAMKEIYAKELETLNPESREVLDKIVTYLEKKYISVPMKMAREVMLSRKSQ